MKVFCDTSVFVAAAFTAHPEHSRAFAVIERVRDGDDLGYAASHALAETFSVMTRHPHLALAPRDAWKILEASFLPHFVFKSLSPDEYSEALKQCATRGIGGGAVYDMLALKAAENIAPERICTFNEREWKRLAPKLASIIQAPDAIKEGE